MTDEEIKRLRELCEKATPGPWFAGSWSGRCYVNHLHSREICEYEHTKDTSGENSKCVSIDNDLYMGLIGWDDYGTVLRNSYTAQFIAEARTALPKCLDQNE